MPGFRQIHSASSSIMKLCVIAALFALFAPGEQVRKLGISIFHATQVKQTKSFYLFPTFYYIVVSLFIVFFNFRHLHMKSVCAC